MGSSLYECPKVKENLPHLKAAASHVQSLQSEVLQALTELFKSMPNDEGAIQAQMSQILHVRLRITFSRICLQSVTDQSCRGNSQVYSHSHTVMPWHATGRPHVPVPRSLAVFGLNRHRSLDSMTNNTLSLFSCINV